MLNINLDKEAKRFYVKISGKITTEDVREFFTEYEKILKTINPRYYILILLVSEFHIESERLLRDAVMMFFRSGFRNIYIVDSDKYVMKNLRLSLIERKIFFSNVTIVNDMSEIR